MQRKYAYVGIMLGEVILFKECVLENSTLYEDIISIIAPRPKIKSLRPDPNHPRLIKIRNLFNRIRNNGLVAFCSTLSSTQLRGDGHQHGPSIRFPRNVKSWERPLCGCQIVGFPSRVHAFKSLRHLAVKRPASRRINR